MSRPALRYFREREALKAREGDMCEVTILGGPIEFLDCGPSVDDYVALARRAYVRGDLSVDELEVELDRLLRVPA